MNSSMLNISEVLNSAKNLISVGFSAGYSFDEKNATKYFDELIENSVLQSPIFSGILIMEKSENTFTIIDGLQRITTISLLLCALCANYQKTSANNENAKNKIFSLFLLDGSEPKLQLENSDQKIYTKLLLGEELTEKELKSNLFQTYRVFLTKISSRKISGTELFKIISKIRFMVIMIEKSEIPARDIYQTLNQNKDKSQINLISSLILQSDALAGLIWQKTVDFYCNLGYQEFFTSFIQDFLVIQNEGELPPKNLLYNKFRTYFNKMTKFQDPQIIAENIYKYAQYYLKIITADFDNVDIQEQIAILNTNNGKDAYPYLMEVLDDLENKHIKADMFLDILIIINSFLAKRLEAPLGGSSVDFASLSKDLNKMLVSPHYTKDIEDENKITINEINNLSTFEV